METDHKHKDMRKDIAFAFLLLSAFALASCKGKQEQDARSPYPTMVVKRDSRSLDSHYSATIRGRQDVEIYPQVSGILQQLLITEGERVSKGQVLFVIDQVPYEAALKTAEADLKSAQAALATARITYEGRQLLLERRVISDFDMQKTTNELASAEAATEQAEARLLNARNDLSYTVIRSPVDGVAGTLPYRQGALVDANMEQPLTVVSDNSSMYVYFSMNESRLLDLLQEYGSSEKAIENMPDINLYLSNGTLYKEKGRIESISGVIDRNTGSVSLRAVFPNPDGLLHSGASGNISIPTRYDSCIVIPQEATFRIQEKVLVYKVEDGRAVSSVVQVSPMDNGREYIVTGGLEEGTEIVAGSVGLLREGTIVKGNINGQGQ